MTPPEKMTGAEFKVVREYLGLSTRWLSDRWGKPERTIQRYDVGESPIPDWVRESMEELSQLTAGFVSTAIDGCRDTAAPAMLTYRTDRDYRLHNPKAGWSASWHRAVVARVAQEVPSLAIEFWKP